MKSHERFQELLGALIFRSPPKTSLSLKALWFISIKIYRNKALVAQFRRILALYLNHHLWELQATTQSMLFGKQRAQPKELKIKSYPSTVQGHWRKRWPKVSRSGFTILNDFSFEFPCQHLGPCGIIHWMNVHLSLFVLQFSP